MTDDHGAPSTRRDREPAAVRATSGWASRAQPWIWMDGRFFNAEPSRVPALAGALHERRGVWEGVRAYATPDGPRLFMLAAHLERLCAGASSLGLAADAAALAWACEELVERHGPHDAYLRLSVFPGSVAGANHAAVTIRPLDAVVNHGRPPAAAGVRATLAVLDDTSGLQSELLKRTGSCPQRLGGQRDAAAAGFDEAIFIDSAGRVIDAAGANVCAVLGGQVVAATHAAALSGITRRIVLELSKGAARSLDRDQLLAAEEVFLVGTSAEITRVRAIDAVSFGDGPVTARLQALYAAVVRRTEATRTVGTLRNGAPAAAERGPRLTTGERVSSYARQVAP